MKRLLTLGDIEAGAGWTQQNGVWKGSYHCKRRQCPNFYIFDVEHGPASQRPWHTNTEELRRYEEAEKAASDEYHAQPLPDTWITVFTADTRKAYCSARCARLALAQIEKKDPDDY